MVRLFKQHLCHVLFTLCIVHCSYAADHALFSSNTNGSICCRSDEMGKITWRGGGLLPLSSLLGTFSRLSKKIRGSAPTSTTGILPLNRSRGIQRQPWRCKMHHRNPWEIKIRKLGGQSLPFCLKGKYVISALNRLNSQTIYR